MGAAHEPDSEDEDAAEQIARDGVRALRNVEVLDAHATRSLLSSARHELGSPLQSIQGFAELLASQAFGALNPEQQGFVEHVLTASGELRGAMDACMELAELELVGQAPIVRRVDLQSTLLTALEQAERRIHVVGTVQGSAPRARVKLDPELFQRALETLLIALATRDSRSFVVAIEAEAEYARVSVARPARPARAELVALPVLAARRQIVRNLLWFRLAGALFAAQDVALALAESLDYAEVRVRLSPTH
ncbi:MAG TPA: histidine kinase dimerization/phospho-acceptor domain-containing protein [Polyangiales bacterium]|nr:histidine kinase dimerization/phospho-acceptor domain-containing protein [Polyangiales bacterium]